MAERGSRSVLANLREAIANLDARRAKLTSGLPDNVRALIEWRKSFEAKLRQMTNNKKRRRQR